MLPYVDLELFLKLAERRANETPRDILTYCAACRDSFAAVGKPSVHILDLIFNPKWQDSLSEPPRMGDDKRENMGELKDMLKQNQNL